ncbi:MAG: hypothetical protein ACAH80_02280, partial [Alphaproteobacteria bacterium]
IDQHREVFNILKGQSKYGMGFVALRVLGDDKKPAHLLVIEDQMRQKMFVVGNESVDPALKEKLAENGVSYSNQGDRDMPSAVNKFFSDCFAFRVSSRVIAAGHERYLEGQMIGAISGVVELPQDLDPASIGNVLAIAKVDPTIYTNIVKEPKPKSKPAAAKR